MQLLFQIDPRPFQIDIERLMAQNAIAREEYGQLVSAETEAAGDLGSLIAQLRAPLEPRNTTLRFSAAAPGAAWWQQFGDPVLATLESQSPANNFDLHSAIARVHSARAAFRQAQYEHSPHVTLDGSYARSREQQPGFTTDRMAIDSLSVGFDATWEIDLFGHLRHQSAAARAMLGAEQASLADAQIFVAAEVARNYFELRGTQRQIAVALENLQSQREALRLTQVRYDVGRVTELDTDSAQARLKATETALPLLQAAKPRYDYRIAVLLGVSRGVLDGQLAPAPMLVMTAALCIGDVSALLRTRRDVRVAERNLAAATKRVGVATADLVPRVGLVSEGRVLCTREL